MTTDGHTASIRSTVHPDTGKAACLLSWGTITALLTPDTALTTARDLMAAAAHADSDVTFIRYCRETLKTDLRTAGFMLRDIRAGRPTPTGTPALRIEALAGIRTGTPRALIHIARGSMKGELTPGEARTMALHWTEAAVAAQIDVRLRYVLGDIPQLTPHDIDSIFTSLQSVQR
ncbi:hypothetical protein [Streptomyces sp. bgisy154]|uniref:hypothetical protein n=1 Tax=Streptomyces sp. bgisy154 TaxID=3413794 RepID=UPI003D757B61